jgi:signal transduction histidine kinase
LLSLLVRPSTPPLWLGVVVAAAFIAVETVLVQELKQLAPGTSFGALFLLGVLVVSARWGFGLAVTTTLASAVVYLYIHLEPAGGLLPARARDWAAMVIFLPIALLANVLAGQARLRAVEADQRRREAEAHRDQLRVLADQQAALRRVATLVARGVAASEVFIAVADELARCLGVSHATLVRYELGGTATLLAGHHQPHDVKFRVGERFSLQDETVSSMVYHTGRAARMDSHAGAAGPSAAYIRKLGLRCGVGAPIVVDGHVWGAAIIGSSRPGPLAADSEKRVGDFADLVATAIANAETRTQLAVSRARIVAAGDEARRRLERDLHDGAQQRLVSLALQVRTVETSVPWEHTELKEQMSDIVKDLIGVSEELQELSRGIHPAILSRGGLGPALKTLARRSAVPVELHLAVDRRLPEAAEVAAYYVVAEGLTNAAKHARASHVDVTVDVEAAALHLLIRDDGVGGADSGRGSGIVGLRDRVEALGGTMQVSSPPGGGTSLKATVPFDLATSSASR